MERAGKLSGTWTRTLSVFTNWWDTILLAVGIGLVASLLLGAAALLLSWNASAESVQAGYADLQSSDERTSPSASDSR
jgi:hypothetical protein